MSPSCDRTERGGLRLGDVSGLNGYVVTDGVGGGARARASVALALSRSGLNREARQEPKQEVGVHLECDVISVELRKSVGA